MVQVRQERARDLGMQIGQRSTGRRLPAGCGDVFRWIAFYNHRRRHSALGYLSPADYEQTLTPATLHQIAA